MNIKVTVAFFAGVLSAVFLVAFICIVMPNVRAEDSAQTSDILPTTSETQFTELVSPLYEVASEIQDQDTREFYDKLIGEYGLAEVSVNVTQAASSNLQEALPDVKRIQHAALTLPLLESGKHIQDRDLAEFYYKFLKDAGWPELTPEEGTQ